MFKPEGVFCVFDLFRTTSGWLVPEELYSRYCSYIIGFHREIFLTQEKPHKQETTRRYNAHMNYPILRDEWLHLWKKIVTIHTVVWSEKGRMILTLELISIIKKSIFIIFSFNNCEYKNSLLSMFYQFIFRFDHYNSTENYYFI